MSSASLLIWVVVAAFFALTWAAGRRGPAWTLMLPLLAWAALVTMSAVRGEIDSIRAVLAAAVALFGILLVSSAGRSSRTKALSTSAGSRSSRGSTPRRGSRTRS